MLYEDYWKGVMNGLHTCVQDPDSFADPQDLIVSSNQIPVEAARQLVQVMAERVPLEEFYVLSSPDEFGWRVLLRACGRWVCLIEADDYFVDYSTDEMQQEVDEIADEVLEGEFDDELVEAFPALMIR